MNDEGFGKKDLRSAEREAVGLKPIEEGADGDNVSGARAEEESAKGFYSGTGRKVATNAGLFRRSNNKAGSSSAGTGGTGSSRGGKSRFLGSLKKGGPVAAIGGILIAVVGLMSGAQSLMPVAIEEMIIEKFNSIGISSTMASDTLLNTQLNYGTLTHSEERGELVNGVQVNLFAFSEYQVQQFEKYGITVVNNISCNNQGVTVLLYKKGSGYNAVVGSDCLGKITNAAIASAAGLSESDILAQVSAKDAFADSSFKTPYTTASKSWRGGSSGWFDQIMSDITEVKLSVNRNRWSKYITKSIKAITDEFKEIASSAAKEAGTAAGSSIYREDVTVGEGEDAHTESQLRSGEPGSSFDVLDENGTKIGETTVGSEELSGSSTPTEIYNVLNSKAVKAASAAADGVCAILNGVMSIYTVVSAYQNLQFLNLISGYLEAVDKMKAGDGDGSPVHEYGINLTTASSTVDNEGNVVEGKESKTAMDSAGMAWLFGKNNSINQNDASVQNVNFESIMNNLSTITGNIELTASIYEKCGYVKAINAGIDLVSTVISFIPIIGQGIKVIQVTAKEVAKLAVKVAAITAFHAIIPIAARKVANLLIKDAATEWFGEDLGNAMLSGASKYLGGNGTSGGQSPGSLSKVLSYMTAQSTVIAEEAEYQRSMRSPFDITSHYTFLGSLAYSIIPFAYSSGGVLSRVRDVSSAVSNSIVAMLPTATAIDEQSVLTSNGTCGLLKTVDVQGDAFCNPYIITDVSTIGIAAEDIVEIVRNMNEGGNEIASLNGKVKSFGGNFEDDGVTIKSGSSLAKYILFCGQRTSEYGLKDAQIASALSGEDSTAVKILSKVPLVSDVTDIVTGIADEANLKWANGKACVASENNSDWEPEYKYYQRYTEIERLLENVDPEYTSPVTEFARGYYEENPLDQSFEGVLARFSGMTKEDVSDTLALIEYYDFLNEYAPEDRFAFGETEDEEKTLLFDNENKIADNIYIILLNEVCFADVRNRSFVV